MDKSITENLRMPSPEFSDALTEGIARRCHDYCQMLWIGEIRRQCFWLRLRLPHPMKPPGALSIVAPDRARCLPLSLVRDAIFCRCRDEFCRVKTCIHRWWEL